VVFFDPDTGMADCLSSSAHIGCSELADTWEVMGAGDILAEYQHAWRDPTWRRRAQARFRDAVGQTPRVYDSPDGAKDVTIMATR
jgi:hypothetical protein